jgi:hypothetical protein
MLCELKWELLGELMATHGDVPEHDLGGPHGPASPSQISSHRSPALSTEYPFSHVLAEVRDPDVA